MTIVVEFTRRCERRQNRLCIEGDRRDQYLAAWLPGATPAPTLCGEAGQAAVPGSWPGNAAARTGHAEVNRGVRQSGPFPGGG